MDTATASSTRRAGIEARLGGYLKGMYPGWYIWSARGWHARRRDNFRQVQDPGAPQYAVHASSPSGLWVALILETGKETGSPVASDAGDGDYGNEVPSRPVRRVHKQGNGRRGGTAPPDSGRLRLI